MEGDWTRGGEHTVQYTDDVLWNCTPETCILLLTNVTPINSIKVKKIKSNTKFMGFKNNFNSHITYCP